MKSENRADRDTVVWKQISYVEMHNLTSVSRFVCRWHITEHISNATLKEIQCQSCHLVQLTRKGEVCRLAKTRCRITVEVENVETDEKVIS